MKLRTWYSGVHHNTSPWCVLLHNSLTFVMRDVQAEHQPHPYCSRWSSGMRHPLVLDKIYWFLQWFSQNILAKMYTDCQGKKAQDKGNFESWPTNARPWDSVLILCSHTCIELHKNWDPAAGKMKTKAYSCSHFLRNWGAKTRGGAGIEQTLPDQLWVSLWVSVSYCFCSQRLQLAWDQGGSLWYSLLLSPIYPGLGLCPFLFFALPSPALSWLRLLCWQRHPCFGLLPPLAGRGGLMGKGTTWVPSLDRIPICDVHVKLRPTQMVYIGAEEKICIGMMGT